MASRDDKQLGAIVGIIILAFLFYLSFQYFSLVLGKSETIISGSVAAFAGAFFAFLFVRIGDFFSRLYRRIIKHYNSVVTLEVELNELIGIIHDNIYTINDIISVINAGNVSWHALHTAPIDKKHLTDLYNPELANRLFQLFYGLRRINNDSETFNNGYRILRDALIQKHITHDNYKENVAIMAEQLTLLKAFLEDTIEETLRLQAEVRILAKTDKPLAATLMHYFIIGSLHRVSKEEVDMELPKLREEIEQSAAESRERRRRVLGS